MASKNSNPETEKLPSTNSNSTHAKSTSGSSHANANPKKKSVPKSQWQSAASRVVKSSSSTTANSETAAAGSAVKSKSKSTRMPLTSTQLQNVQSQIKSPGTASDARSMENSDPELVIAMLRCPSVRNYRGLKHLIEKSTKAWIEEFLELDGLGILLESLDTLSRGSGATVSIANTVLQVEHVGCIKAVMNSRVGLDYIVQSPDCVRKLTNGLDTKNTAVKKQIFDLLCAVSIYNGRGHALVLEALDNFQQAKPFRFRLSVVIEELSLPTDQVPPEYKATLLAFVNCLILGCEEFTERIKIRRELISIGLRPILQELRTTQEDSICIQCEVFDTNEHADEVKAEENGLTSNHYKLFEELLELVQDGPHSFHFLSLLENLLYWERQVKNNAEDADKMWRYVLQVSSDRLKLSTDLETKNVGTQTTVNASPVRKVMKIPFWAQKFGIGNLASTLGSQKGNETVIDGPQAPVLRNEAETQAEHPKVSTSTQPPPPIPPPIVNGHSLEAATTAPKTPISNPPPPPPLPDSTAPASIAQPPPPPPPPPPMMPGSATNAVNFPSPQPPPPMLPDLIPGLIPKGAPPPPPPMMPGSGPRPPPPPPMLPDASGRIPIEEPLVIAKKAFMTYSTQSPAGPACSPNVFAKLPTPKSKTKRLNWTRVPNQVLGNSVWMDIHKNYGEPTTNLLTSHADEAEQLFCEKRDTGAVDLGTGTQLATTSSSKPKAPPKVTLLDSRRSMNIDIFLKQFKMSSEALIELIRKGASAELGAERLHGLLDVYPNEGEVELLASFEDELDKLATAERFYKLLVTTLPAYRLRTEIMILREEFNPTRDAIVAQAQVIIETGQGIMKSSSFQGFLGFILSTGNFLNTGSYAGNAPGFKLNALEKLIDTKANKPRVTLLHFVVEIIEKENPKWLDFAEKDFSRLPEACKVSIEQLEGQISEVAVKVKKIENQLGNKKAEYDEVRSQHGEFVTNVATVELPALNSRLEEAKQLQTEVGHFFCEDVAKFKLDDFFKLMHGFCEKLKVVRKENEERKQREARLAAIKAKNASSSSLGIGSGTDSAGAGAPGPGSLKSRPNSLAAHNKEEKCVVDMLLDEIRKGSFQLRKTQSAHA